MSHELIGDRTVDDAMVKAQSGVADRADANGVAHRHRCFVNRAEPEDSGLRLIDRRRRE